MNEADIKEEVIEETCNFTFINGEYVEVKEEEIEQKPENLLEQEIKTESIDFFEKNNSDEFCEDIKLEPEESDSKIEKVSSRITERICEICQKRMPRYLLKLIKTAEDKVVLSDVFKIREFMGTLPNYVCYAHIQTIIDDKHGKLRFASTSSGKLLRSFIAKNKHLMQVHKKSINVLFKVSEKPGHQKNEFAMFVTWLKRVLNCSALVQRNFEW
ncbi:hypothetical protein B9Z55_021059 [Caenorhabditis nigoni]|uniref:Uncharacterized protein n=1 Tax=Caenorhabditis nigoni TaxID=1611254 RepID=A0A2G5TQI0_9PELO|nr:hypothetical protein B9Z55_021059 [Caenorhabditis nigoni]